MKNILFYSMLSVSLLACTNDDLINALPDNRPNYKASTTINPLELPPDLTQSSIDDGRVVSELSATSDASLNDYTNERSASGQKSSGLEASLQSIHSSGDATWIEMDALPTDVFRQAKNFWMNAGLPLSRIDENIGIMETDWLENKANLPENGVTALLSRALSGLHDDGKRDKFRTRIDYDGQKSYVYLTHYGASEEEVDRNGKIVKSQTQSTKGEVSNYTWAATSRNPELEVEMLRRLNLHLRKNANQVATEPTADVEQKRGNLAMTQLNDGTPVLTIDADFNRAWVLLGIAIDRAGYNLSSQSRQNGMYSFEKITERKAGFIIKKVERDIDAYQVGLADQGNQQIAVVRSVNGKAPTAEQARAILQKISQEIQF